MKKIVLSIFLILCLVGCRAKKETVIAYSKVVSVDVFYAGWVGGTKKTIKLDSGHTIVASAYSYEWLATGQDVAVVRVDNALGGVYYHFRPIR